MAIPELMRILVDEKNLPWEVAEDITRRCFAYTNHTVMQEALEKWPEDMVRMQLPRIYMILQELNRRECQALWDTYPGQWERIGHMAILAYGQVHMANLCVYMSHSVNGVSRIHTDILRRQTFKDFYVREPEKFVSITNGITHRPLAHAVQPGPFGFDRRGHRPGLAQGARKAFRARPSPGARPSGSNSPRSSSKTRSV